jgi:hypothetical protein
MQSNRVVPGDHIGIRIGIGIGGRLALTRQM